jgi:hypothetical protein
MEKAGREGVIEIPLYATLQGAISSKKAKDLFGPFTIDYYTSCGIIQAPHLEGVMDPGRTVWGNTRICP